MLTTCFRFYFLPVLWLGLSQWGLAQRITISRSEGQAESTITHNLPLPSAKNNKGAKQAADFCNLRTNPVLKSTQICAGPGAGPIYYSLFTFADLGSNCDGPISFEMSDSAGNFDKPTTIVTGPTNVALFDSLFYHTLPANIPAGTTYKFRFRYQNMMAVSNEIGPVTINALPTPTLTNDGPLSCLKSSVILTAGGGLSGATYAFSTGITQSANQSGASALITQAGPYSVTVTNPGGCSASALTTVSSHTIIPTVSLTNTGPVNVNNPSVLLRAQGGNTYAFNSPVIQPDGPASGTAIVTNPGFYSVTVTGPDGCTAMASTLVTGGLSQSACPTDTAVLRIITGGNPVQYDWYRNSTYSAPLTDMASSQWGSHTASLTVTNQLTTGDYYLRTTEANGASVTYGPVRISVNPTCQGYIQPVVYLADSFTPNGDGINDSWTIVFPFPILTLESLTIVNRWGEILYRRDSGVLKSGDTLWDGVYQGVTLAGVYTYQLSVQFPTGLPQRYQGRIVIIQ
jgi:gliding motility-associated-like protein